MWTTYRSCSLSIWTIHPCEYKVLNCFTNSDCFIFTFTKFYSWHVELISISHCRFISRLFLQIIISIHSKPFSSAHGHVRLFARSRGRKLTCPIHCYSYNNHICQCRGSNTGGTAIWVSVCSTGEPYGTAGANCLIGWFYTTARKEAVISIAKMTLNI